MSLNFKYFLAKTYHKKLNVYGCSKRNSQQRGVKLLKSSEKQQ